MSRFALVFVLLFTAPSLALAQTDGTTDAPAPPTPPEGGEVAPPAAPTPPDAPAAPA